MDFNNDLMNIGRRHEKKHGFIWRKSGVMILLQLLFQPIVYYFYDVYIHTSILECFEFQISFIFCRGYIYRYIAGVSQTQYFISKQFLHAFFGYYFLAFNLVFSLQVLDISVVPEIDASVCSFFFLIVVNIHEIGYLKSTRIFSILEIPLSPYR